MGTPTNQHYLPVFYLKGFTSRGGRGKLFVFQNGHSHWTMRGVRSVGAIPHLHSPVGPDGQVYYGIEEMLSRLESEFSVVHSKVLAGEPLSTDEEITFATLIAVMWLRVPAEVEHHNQQWTKLGQRVLEIAHHHYTADPDALERFKREYQARTGERSVEQLTADQLNPEAVEVEANRHATFMGIMGAAVESSKLIFLMGWTFLKAETLEALLTSDHPVLLSDPTNTSRVYGTGLAHRNAELTMPLSRGLAFVAGWKMQRRRWLTIPAPLVQTINERTAAMATRELVAPSRLFPGSDKALGTFYPGYPRPQSGS